MLIFVGLPHTSTVAVLGSSVKLTRSLEALVRRTKCNGEEQRFAVCLSYQSISNGLGTYFGSIYRIDVRLNFVITAL